MARQTFYVTREVRHPLYRTRMLTAGQPLELDAGAAALYRKLGVPLDDEKPTRRELAAAAAETAAPATEAPKPRRRARRKK